MTSHLATRGGILCHTVARWPARSGQLCDVTCRRCAHELAVVTDAENDAASERRRMAAAAEAAAFLGADRVWSLVVASGDSATERMVREMLAAILIGLAETHQPPPDRGAHIPSSGGSVSCPLWA